MLGQDTRGLALYRPYRIALQEDLSKIEQQIFDLETAYLGASLKDAKSLAAARAGKLGDIPPVDPQDRIFSLSSLTSPLGDAPFPKPATKASSSSAAAASGGS